MKGARADGLLRVLQLLKRLQDLDAPALDAWAAEFRVHPRTIRRDLDLIERAGFRVRFRDLSRAGGDRGRWVGVIGRES